MAALRPITQTCQPREDVLGGGLTDAHFAAQLDKVVSKPGEYPVYGDPTSFFAVTHPTEGLKDLLTSTFGRLSGRAGHVAGAEHGVVRFQTSFGGGKTHGLIAAYHLASGARPIGVEDFVDPDLLPEDCRVAAVVGDTLDPVGGSTVNGRRIYTMWGSIAAQLGDEAWDAVAEQDARRTAPGKDTWTDVFGGRPTLVIIDEVAAHMRALSTSGDEDIRRQADAVPAFLFNLFSAAASTDTTRVIITLATASDAFGRETTEVERLLNKKTDASGDAESVMDRYREILVPAKDEEIASILRRRLFSRVDETAAEEAASSFHAYYTELERREVRLGQLAGIEDQIRASYPFHPELVSVLDARVGTIPSFQRTRGALRLLAESVAALWDREAQTPIINVADLPLDAEPVAQAVTRAIDREPFAPVLEADVAGRGSHAAEVDHVRFPGVTPYATRTATTVFLHSLEQTAATGATIVDVWRGTLIPGDDPDLIQDALGAIEQKAWHFAYDSSRYRFQTEPNPRKIVEDEKPAVANSMVREELDRRISGMFASSGPIRTKVFPDEPADLDDRPELQLAVIHYDDLTVDSGSASPTPLHLVELLDTHGVAGSNRTYRNGLVFLVGDTDQVDTMRELVRYHMAAHRIVSDGQRMQGYATEVQKRLRDIDDKAGLDARVAITRCYRHLYYPKADSANNHLRHHELPPTKHGEQERSQTPVIQEVLEGIGKIRTTPISTDFLASIAGFPKTDPISTAMAVDGFWRNHDADLVLNPNLLIEAIVAGVRNGTWVYYDAQTEKAYTSDAPPPAPRIAPTSFLYSREEAEADGLLRRDPTWEDIHREIREAGGRVSATDLRARLERSLKAEPSKTAVVEVLARVVRQEEPPVVVVEGDPTADTKPLPPSSVERVAFDRLTILTRDRAVDLGMELVVRTRGFRLEESGAAGQVFATLADKLAELGEDKRIEHAEVRMSVTGGTVGPLRTLLSAVPMLPRIDFTITLMAGASYEDLSGDIMVTNLSGHSDAFRRIDKLVLDLLDKADDLTANITLGYTPEEPIDPADPEWKSFASTFVDLKPGPLTTLVRGR